MGSSSPAPVAPPAPAPIDPGKSSIDYINAMADPALQAKLLQSEQTYRPEYNKLELADINQLMYGAEGQQGYLGLSADAARQSGALEAELLSKQRAADIGDVEALGGRASAVASLAVHFGFSRHCRSWFSQCAAMDYGRAAKRVYVCML